MATNPVTQSRIPDGVRLPAGIGLRLPHLAEVVATRPPLGWVEVHPENVLANPHAAELLFDLARTTPVSVHTVGISLGSADGIDAHHLARLARFVDRLDPMLVSGHLAWSSHGGAYLNDLLPLPYTEESLAVVADHLSRVQDVLGRPFLIENPSSYVGFTDSTMDEVTFLRALVARSGCRLLCDLSNIHVSGHNMGYDPFAYLRRFPLDAVDEFHLGGFTPEDDEATPGATLFVDTHAHPVAEEVWPLYAEASSQRPDVPTLIEWDNDLPSLATLLEQARRADRVSAGSQVLHAR